MCDRSHEQPYNPIENEHYESDIRYTLQQCQWVLKPIGIWPLISDRATRFEKISSVALIITCSSALCFVFIPSSYHTLFREKRFHVKVKLFGPCFFCLTTIIKYCYLGLRSASFGLCLKHLEDDWKALKAQNHRAVMLKNVTLARNLTSLSAMFLYTGGLSYHAALPLLSKAFFESNANLTVRPLIYSGYDVLFDPQASPAYEIVFTIHCIFSVITYNITVAACSLAAIFVSHACGQIQIQKLRLKDLNEEIRGRMKFQNSTDGALAVIVRDHVRVLRFSEYIETVLREICLMETVTSTLLICILEYDVMMEWENSDKLAILTYSILLISFTFNMLIFCYIGELLVEEGSKIGTASYEIEWYNLPGKKALDFVMLIAMSKYPPKLTAGKIFDLSMNTFSTVLKSSVMYLNLLRTASG